MKKIIDYISKQKWYQWCMTHDKLAHLIGGFILSLVYLPLIIFFAPELAVGISLLFCSILFFGKEFFDKYKPNPTGFDTIDIFAGFIGWGIGTWISALIQILILIIK